MPLPTSQQLQMPRAADAGLFRKVLLGLSCRDYAACAEAVPEAFGLSPSSVSRRFLRASARQLQAVQERRLALEAPGGLRVPDLRRGEGGPGPVPPGTAPLERIGRHERAAILADGDLVGPALLPQPLQLAAATRLHGEGGIFLPPARRLGIARVTLRAKIRRYGLA